MLYANTDALSSTCPHSENRGHVVGGSHEATVHDQNHQSTLGAARVPRVVQELQVAPEVVVCLEQLAPTRLAEGALGW